MKTPFQQATVLFTMGSLILTFVVIFLSIIQGSTLVFDMKAPFQILFVFWYCLSFASCILHYSQWINSMTRKYQAKLFDVFLSWRNLFIYLVFGFANMAIDKIFFSIPQLDRGFYIIGWIGASFAIQAVIIFIIGVFVARSK